MDPGFKQKKTKLIQFSVPKQYFWEAKVRISKNTLIFIHFKSHTFIVIISNGNKP